jgi:hypothetical protein
MVQIVSFPMLFGLSTTSWKSYGLRRPGEHGPSSSLLRNAISDVSLHTDTLSLQRAISLSKKIQQ